jgi:hypothetical protein
LPAKDDATLNPLFSSLFLLMSCTDTLFPYFLFDFSKWLGENIGKDEGLW